MSYVFKNTDLMTIYDALTGGSGLGPVVNGIYQAINQNNPAAPNGTNYILWNCLRSGSLSQTVADSLQKEIGGIDYDVIGTQVYSGKYTAELLFSTEQNTKDTKINTGNINTNTSTIVTNTGTTATNTGTTATNTGHIVTNTGTIATNTGTIATNTGNTATYLSTIRTPVLTSTTGNLTIAPQVHNISVYNSGAANGTINVNGGGNITIPAGVTVNFDAGGNNNRYPVNVFVLNATGTTFIVSYTQ